MIYQASVPIGINKHVKDNNCVSSNVGMIVQVAFSSEIFILNKKTL